MNKSLKEKKHELLKELQKTDTVKPKIPKGLTLTGNDTIRPDSTSNVAILLDCDPNLKGMIRYNDFTEEIDVVKDVTIDMTKLGIPKIHFPVDTLNDNHLALLATYFSGCPSYQVSFSKSALRGGIRAVAKANSYNPLADYFEKCYRNWDKKERIDDFFQKYLGCYDTVVTRLIADLFFRAVVAKGYAGRLKYDYVLDLVGSQGCGKTTLLRKIAPLGFYTDSFITFTDKDDLYQMKNAVIINDDEMTASACMTNAQIKKFVTTETFSFRPAYHEHSVTFKKKFVITRTSNNILHLSDRTGDRRFLPLLCNSKRQIYHPVRDLTQETVDQIWGEAVERWLKNDSFVLDRKQELLLEENRMAFSIKDELLETVDDLLKRKYKNVKFIVKGNFYNELLIANGGLNRREKRRVMEHLAALEYKEAFGHVKIDGQWKSMRGFKKEN